MTKIKRALVSVSDKKGLKELARELNELGVEILSTGGTARFIENLGIPVRKVSDFTSFPEMLDGRVKTLHPKIHGGLLALRDNPEHMEEAKKAGIELIDMVVVNLYPFQEVVGRPGVTREEAIENIDIGGPSMLRSAAKNHRSVAVVSSPSQYPQILTELRENKGVLSSQTLANLAAAVFSLTASYDRAIAGYFAGAPVALPAPSAARQAGEAEEKLTLEFVKVQDLRYGENPHQKAAFYRDPKTQETSVATSHKLQGKELSFNNIMDLNSGLEIVREFDEPAASIIKHNNPCGAAYARRLAAAYKDALACDPLSAFGSIIGLNRRVDKETASAIAGAGFVEAVIAPGFSEEALAILGKKKDLRILETGEFSGPDPRDKDFKKVVGGILIQDKDAAKIDPRALKTVTKKKPAPEEIKSLLFGFRICKHVKSNAIVLTQGAKTVGIGAGQMSRVDSVIIAVRKAGKRAKDSVLASDAFFPKPDGVEEAAKAGVRAIIQPGGSLSDAEIIKTCDRLGLSMVFTGIRHFRH